MSAERSGCGTRSSHTPDEKVSGGAAARSANATRAWIDERTLVGDTQSLQTVPSVVVAGEVRVGSTPPEAQALLTHRSSKLLDILKVLLCYSNNFMAERIGETIGGPQAVRVLLIDKLKINPDEFQISTTSGLGINRVTPRAMMGGNLSAPQTFQWRAPRCSTAL